MKKLFGILAAVFALSAISCPIQAATLTEITFGPFNGGTLAAGYGSGNAQFVTTDAGVTYNTPSAALRVIGGTASTSSWVYAGTAASSSATNTNLFDSASASFASASRMDIDLGFASSGNTYTITGAELVMRANNDTGARWSMGYRDASNAPQTVDSVALDPPGGDTTKLFSIDLSGAGLSATDSSTTFGTGGTGGIRFLFYDTDDDAANDNFQVQTIRILGTVTAIPEPSSLALLGLGGLTMLRRRRK